MISSSSSIKNAYMFVTLIVVDQKPLDRGITIRERFCGGYSNLLRSRVMTELRYADDIWEFHSRRTKE